MNFLQNPWESTLSRMYVFRLTREWECVRDTESPLTVGDEKGLFFRNDFPTKSYYGLERENKKKKPHPEKLMNIMTEMQNFLSSFLCDDDSLLSKWEFLFQRVALNTINMSSWKRGNIEMRERYSNDFPGDKPREQMKQNEGKSKHMTHSLFIACLSIREWMASSVCDFVSKYLTNIKHNDMQTLGNIIFEESKVTTPGQPGKEAFRKNRLLPVAFSVVFMVKRRVRVYCRFCRRYEGSLSSSNLCLFNWRWGTSRESREKTTAAARESCTDFTSSLDVDRSARREEQSCFHSPCSLVQSPVLWDSFHCKRAFTSHFRIDTWIHSQFKGEYKWRVSFFIVSQRPVLKTVLRRNKMYYICVYSPLQKREWQACYWHCVMRRACFLARTATRGIFHSIVKRGRHQEGS